MKLDLAVLLPLGTEDGEYSIEVRNAWGEVVVQAVGRARWNGTAEMLAAKSREPNYATVCSNAVPQKEWYPDFSPGSVPLQLIREFEAGR